MNSVDNKAVRARVLIPLTLTFIVLLSIFIYSGYKIRQAAIGHSVEHRYTGIKSLFDELVQQRTDLLTSTLKFITNQAQFAQLMQSGERANLLKSTRPVLEELSQGHGITHFYFHAPDGRNFLRVHKPETYGDLIGRSSLVESRRTGKISHGIELGAFGTYTLRVVSPWIYNNQLIGYVELGEEIGSVLKNLKKITGTDFLMAVDKKFLNRVKWEEGARMMQRTNNWDMFRDKVIIGQTINGIPHSLEKQLEWQSQHDELGHREGDIENRSYQIKNFPLLDDSKNVVGDFVVLIDVSREQSDFYRFLNHIVFLSLLLCSALFVFAYKILGRVDFDLAKAREQLFGQIDNANKINLLLKQENTERKKAEQELKLLNDELEKRVADRTKKLEEAHEDLQAQHATILHQDKMAGIGQLAAGVAHDINNPIGFVVNNLSELDIYTKDMCRYIEVLEKALGSVELSDNVINNIAKERRDLHIDYIYEDLDDILKESLEGANRISRIVRNLKSFSRLDNNDFELTDIEECLDSTINITANELLYKAEVIREYEHIPPILCFSGQLNQVFMNLLINAVQSMQEYGTIVVKTSKDKDFACISISDTGSGIPSETLERIFEPFYTTKPVGSGTGLGLSITYDIVKKHKGHIAVDSEVGRGTTFVIRLPYTKEDIISTEENPLRR